MENKFYEKGISIYVIGKKVFFLFFFFIILILCSLGDSNLVRVKSGVDFQISSGGDIIWNNKGTTATTSIRWRTQGFNILLKETKYGYPFGSDNKEKDEHININFQFDDIDKTNITPNVREGEVATYRMTIKWDTMKQKINKNPKFYKALKNRVEKNGKVELFINSYFETYQIVKAPEIEKAFKNKDNPKYKMDFIGNLYRRDNTFFGYENGYVYKLLQRNLFNVGQIKNAQNWKNKNDWEKKENKYYNVPIKLVVARNFLIKLVDDKGNMIGEDIKNFKQEKRIEKFLKSHPYLQSKKSEDELLRTGDFRLAKIVEGRNRVKTRFNPRMGIKEKNFSDFGVENESKRSGLKANFRIPMKIIRASDGRVYQLVGCYSLGKNKRKLYKTELKKKENTGGYFLEYQEELSLNTNVYYGEYKLSDEIIKGDDDSMEDEGEAEPVGIIGSGTLEKSEFNIEDGIPVTETYYKNIRVEEYILNYRFVKKTGKETYPAKSRIRWNLSWQETVGSGKKAKTVTKTKTVTEYYNTLVTRDYSYWIIDKLEYYTIDGAIINNLALADTGEMMNPIYYDPAKLDFLHSDRLEDHIEKPRILNRVIDLGSKSGNGTSPPYYNPSSEVDSLVGKILVKNDRLSIDGTVYMNDSQKEGKTDMPLKPPAVGKICGEKVLYSFGKRIEVSKKNGLYESDGKVIFTMKKSVNPENEKELEIDIVEINPVQVHTPVISDYIIQDASKWCQLVEPDLSLYQLVLTKSFDLEIITSGSHLNIKGYGNRDYLRYTLKKEVIFPFDVLMEDRVVRAHEPITIASNTRFTMPYYVKEGVYDIKILVYALNSMGEEERQEEYANISISNYVATKAIPVEVSGRLIDFRLENIKNTSLWSKIFNKADQFRGFSLRYLPLINGDHPVYKNIGDFKKGYALSFGITTIGQYLSEPYGVLLELSFFVYDEKFLIRKPVDLYYEAISEKDNKWLGLVKVGSKKDKRNLHFYKDEEKLIPMFTYNQIQLPHEFLEIDSTASIQRWRGEYSLPARLYVCEKGLDIEEEIKKRTGFFYDEDFWIKQGKLVVKADIYSLKNRKKILSYLNEDNMKYGHLNNWKHETNNRRKIIYGDEVDFKYGEVFVYDIARTIWLERLSKIYKGW